MHMIRWVSGYGPYKNLQELLEVVTWSQLGIHDKPVKQLHDSD